MKAYFYILAVCLWFSPALQAQGQEQETTADQSEQASQEAEGESQAEAPEAMPDIGLIEEEATIIEDDENFVPSVRITEDLPVAFPVDI